MFDALPSLLALSILLGLLHILLAATLANGTRGFGWAMGSRDLPSPPLSLHAERARRAAANFLETFPFFAAALVCAIAISRDGSQAVLGAQLYFWARLAYLPIYLLGIPLIRSVVWGVSLAGILMLVFALF